MSKNKPLWIDGILGSQLRDTQGEMLSIEGADISELEAGRGRWNDNHGRGSWNCLGRITSAKKIFKAEDCDNDRQRYYWEKIKAPYIYGTGYLFNDEDHQNAKACAAILRNIHKTDSPLKLKLSVEGGVVSRGISDPTLLARTKVHSCAITFVPANQATLVEPLNLDKSISSYEEDLVLIKSVLHLAETNVPSFRHIVRDASAERIENNVNEIMMALGAEDRLALKQELIKNSLESKITENIIRIHELVKGVPGPDEHHYNIKQGYTGNDAKKAQINAVKQMMHNKWHQNFKKRNPDERLSHHEKYPPLSPQFKHIFPDDAQEKLTYTKAKAMEKALTAGYGGAGAPGGLSGGGVMQGESLGPKQLSFITCDDCGKEQVYGKFQVKCRDCGKAFSMAKLEKFFHKRK